ncbi:MAG: glycosyltransferase [Prosthecobacter sp.]|nr:glycosyltransferase [Prosthecobacter sp.]
MKMDVSSAEGRDMRPTILHYTFHLGGGGAEAMLMNLVEKLDPSRFRSVVVAVNTTPWPDLVQRLVAAGVTLHSLESLSFGSFARLCAILRAERPDIVQTWIQQSDFVGGWAARLAGVPKVIWSIHTLETFHDPKESRFMIASLRWALVISSRFIPSRIISCSAAAIETHAAMGYPRSKMHWIPNGIDTERFIPDAKAAFATRAELQLPSDVPVIGFAGRFHGAKDLTTFLRATALLQSRIPRAYFLLCGGLESDLSDKERAAFALLPSPGQVRFEAFRTDPWCIYPALDVYSLSSRSEACPMSIIEAMSCGVPCVATDVGDCAFLLEGAGCVVPAGDSEALANAWEQTLRPGRESKNENATRLRSRVQERFSIAQAIGSYAETYLRLLGKWK